MPDAEVDRASVATPGREEAPFAPWPHYDEDEVRAVQEVLRSGKVNYWTGEEGRAFEDEYARYLSRRHSIAVANGTLTLELALYAFGVGPGDEVVTTSRTFIASASAAVMRGATPVIADVDRDSGNLTAETVAPLITPRTKAIIPVHLAGWPCEMDAIMDLAREHDLVVIEDCAQAHGATYRGRPVGSFGHAASFSFCQDKIITTGGEGGLLALDDEAAWERAWAYKDHGKSYDAVYRREHPPGYRWLHESFGTNWRLTEMQAAIGRIQLGKLDRWHRRRKEHADRLTRAFEGVAGLRTVRPPSHVEHAYYKYYVYLEPEALAHGWNKTRIIEEVESRGVPCFAGTCSEIYLEKAFQDAGLAPDERRPVARELDETTLMFLVHPTLDDRAIARTAEVVADVMVSATR